MEDNPNSADLQAAVYLRGGGCELYGDGVVHAVYPPHWRTCAVLAKVSADPVRYERRLADGGLEVFAQSDGVVTSGRRVYLTDIVDPQGLTVHLTYDSSLRLIAVTDAAGLVSTLSYELASDPLKITKFTDPYGRSALITYNASGQLASITDVINLTSSFVYGPNDFIASLTTPYGTTLFASETDSAGDTFRFIQATDPLGGTERVEFHWWDAAMDAAVPANQVPAGFAAYNVEMNRGNSFYWDKQAMALGAGDVTRAVLTHWLMQTETSYVSIFITQSPSASVPHSIKRPLEHRVWYAPTTRTAACASLGDRAPCDQLP